LVSNSVRHAGLRAEDWIEVSAYVRQGCLRVEVDDPGTTRASATDETWFHDRAGWGFILRSELASRWSIQGAEQTSAWFEMYF
jgi:anti-sigma regulatory factor (Ser/Thr protein kinase)